MVFSVLKISAIILPIYNTLLASDKVTKQAYDILQLKLDCLPWSSSKKLSQRQGEAVQADTTLVSRKGKICCYQTSFNSDKAATVLHQSLNAGHWGNNYICCFCRCFGIIDHDRSEQMWIFCQTNAASLGTVTITIILPMTHLYLKCHGFANAGQWDGSKKSFCESCCSHHLLAGSAFEPSKAQQDRAAKAKCLALPWFLFGLWIKWSPGLGGGATSCPCLASKGSYSLPS